jgi:ectoine hydroxylase-related dioxygenase (phytanoyl-CoA dioxygenase family)
MTAHATLDSARVAELVGDTLRDGHCILRGHFDPALLHRWNDAFAPLLRAHLEREGGKRNRGTNRYYVTLPFTAPFADPAIYEDDDVLAVVGGLVGEDPVLCQLATDTPLEGSDYQDIHRDAPPLFPESRRETPPFQLAVNFPLVPVTLENGPMEVARGTHLMARDQALAQVRSGEIPLEAVTMELGDVMIRDVRALHRGTPNRTTVARPMVVLGYSRRWLYRPEVAIRMPGAALPGLSPRARSLLRYNPIVEDLDEPEEESYQAFAY